MTMIDCLYCARTGEATLEHIWPQALGGAYCGQLFETRNVCRRCNSLAGLWIDGAFLKSWFIQHERGLHAQAFLDPARPGLMPYAYLGTDLAFPCDGSEICDRWLGPSGESLYHVHGRDGPSWDAMAGGDFLKRKALDPGRTYLGLVDRGQYRALVALASATAQFPRARRHCLTDLVGAPPRLLSELIVPEDRTEVEASEIAWLRTRPHVEQPMQATIGVDFSDRFLAKLALGLGHNICGQGFAESAYADDLRRMLWPHRADAEPEHVRGSGYWGGGRGLARAVAIEKSWTLILSLYPEGLGLTLILPSGRDLSILVADRSAMPSAIDPAYDAGVVYAILPARRTMTGPITLDALVRHRLAGTGEPSLDQLAQWRALAATVQDRDFG